MTTSDSTENKSLKERHRKKDFSSRVKEANKSRSQAVCVGLFRSHTSLTLTVGRMGCQMHWDSFTLPGFEFCSVAFLLNRHDSTANRVKGHCPQQYHLICHGGTLKKKSLISLTGMVTEAEVMEIPDVRRLEIKLCQQTRPVAPTKL